MLYPYGNHTPPFYPSPHQRSSPGKNQTPGGRLRTGAIVALTLLLALVFGTGLFAGWEFGRGSGSCALCVVAGSSCGEDS
jgi:hypothetical protein